MYGSNGKAIGHFFERDFGRSFHVLSSELGLAENERQSHREAASVRGADELFRIGSGLAFEATAEAIRIIFERAALGRNSAFAVLDSALPDGCSMGFHPRSSLLWPSPKMPKLEDDPSSNHAMTVGLQFSA